MRERWGCVLLAVVLGAGGPGLAAAVDPSDEPETLAPQLAPVVLPTKAPFTGKTYYVRQTVGDDANDGLSPQTAWQHFAKLQDALHAGDTAYVGPGLYREGVTLAHDGAVDQPITIVADSAGTHTGDPPGIVMIAGSDPVDEQSFEPTDKPGMFRLPTSPTVVGVTEMDGDQYRYVRVTITKEFHVDKMAPVDIVAKLPSSFHYDDAAKVLYIHTSDGKPPTTHEIELFHRDGGIAMTGKHYVTVIGFVFRHFGDGGIRFFQGSGNGIALDNIAYGCRQGIRIYTATNILVRGNTLFRNENCGVYLANHSENGTVVGNTMYDNIKGIRWGSKSVNGVAVDNVAFDNLERGISVEDTNNVTLVRNRMVNNAISQLMIFQSDYSAEANCFDNGGPAQFVADFFFGPTVQYRTLAAYQQAAHRDVLSREGGCGALPPKLDVHKLNADATSYTDRARALLRERARAAASTPTPLQRSPRRHRATPAAP